VEEAIAAARAIESVGGSTGWVESEIENVPLPEPEAIEAPTGLSSRAVTTKSP